MEILIMYTIVLCSVILLFIINCFLLWLLTYINTFIYSSYLFILIFYHMMMWSLDLYNCQLPSVFDWGGTQNFSQ